MQPLPVRKKSNEPLLQNRRQIVFLHIMSISKTYLPKETEEKWYSYWLEHNFFKSVPDEREPYTIVIPPPNVTGVLHMGHMLNNTIQDVLIRRARMKGKNACWVPGTDHASIATEAKVVAMLERAWYQQKRLNPYRVFKLCLGVERKIRRYYTGATQEVGRIMRLGPYPFYYGG